MCTFILSRDLESQSDLILRSKPGGPDLTTKTTYKDFTILHNLLWITGDFTQQPYSTDTYDFFLLGEVYNYVGKSELEFIYDLYISYRDKFIDHIDGEFLIIIVDKSSNLVHFYTDPWSTRQLWASENTFSTLQHAGSQRLKENSHYVWDGNNLNLMNNCLVTWDLSQHKDSLTDIHKALEEAVVKRWHEDSVLLLSGGTDSSTIAVILQKYELPTTCVSFDFTANRDESDNIRKIKQHASIHNYIFLDDLSSQSLTNDLASRIRDLGKRVCLTGNDYDGVYENYIHKPKVQTPNMFDSFPEDLSTIFPWYHFGNGIVRKICDVWETAYLEKSIELRNCYLDKILVQEFLWLSNSLKNIRPKHFLRSYLEQHNVDLEFKNIGYKGHIAAGSIKNDNMAF